MPKVARVQQWDAIRGETAQLATAAQYEHHYYAFLSYSHRDEATAKWLHESLEHFRVPSAIAGRLTQNGVIPKRLTPIFRDQHELAAADDLGAEIRAARPWAPQCSESAFREISAGARCDPRRPPIP